MKNRGHRRKSETALKRCRPCSSYARAAFLAVIFLALGLPSPAGCRNAPLSPRVAVIFSGHTQSLTVHGNHQGAKSASGVYEYRFNDRVTALFNTKTGPKIKYKTVPASQNIPIRRRPALARKLGSSVMIEIHHDSVQPHLLQCLQRAKPGEPLLEYYRGFSIHVYPEEQSINLAKAIESRMISAGLKWSEYHTENIPGERMKLIPGSKAVYERRNLFILKNSSIPTVIIECGCIANPDEEHILTREDHIRKIVDAIHEAVLDFMTEAMRTGISSRQEYISELQH